MYQLLQLIDVLIDVLMKLCTDLINYFIFLMYVKNLEYLDPLQVLLNLLTKVGPADEERAR